VGSNPAAGMDVRLRTVDNLFTGVLPGVFVPP